MKYVLLILNLLIGLVVATVVGCNREQMKPAVAPASLVNSVVSTTTILATISDQDRQVDSGTPGASHSGTSGIVFSELGSGVAYLVESNGAYKLVHNGKAGKAYQQIDANFALSRDGGRVAYRAMVDGKWRMVVDGTEGKDFVTLGTQWISPDGKHVMYDAQLGDRWYLVVDGQITGGVESYFDKIFIKGSDKIVYVENSTGEDHKHKVIISNLLFKKLFEKELHSENIIYNLDKSRMAVVAGVKGEKRLVQLSLDKPGTVSEGAQFDDVMLPAFGADGASVAYIGEKKGKRYLVLNGNEELLPAGDVLEPPVIKPDLKGAGIIIKTNGGSYFHQTGSYGGVKGKRYEEAALLSYNASGDSYVYAARNGKKMFYVVNGKESQSFDKVLAPVFSPDGKLIVCRVRKDGKRFVIVLNGSGQVVRQHPFHEMIFNPVFTADGKSVAYGVKDGSQLVWTVEKL